MAFANPTSLLTRVYGLTDPVVGLQVGQVIVKGLLSGHLATGNRSAGASVSGHLPANPKPVCLHLHLQRTLSTMCLPLSQLPRSIPLLNWFVGFSSIGRD